MTEDIKLLETLLADIKYLINKTNEIHIPPKYHNTSLRREAMCDLSYQTGRRDQMFSQLHEIEWLLATAEGKFNADLERNYQEHLKDEEQDNE